MAKASPVRWITPADRKWDANAVYKAFVEFLNNADADELSTVQRIAYLAHHYDNDARSKGHARFFADRDKKTINATVRALESIGALAHAQVLRDAHAAKVASQHDRNLLALERIEKHLRGYLDTFEAHFVRESPESCGR
jgi:hypothetical protein